MPLALETWGANRWTTREVLNYVTSEGRILQGHTNKSKHELSDITCKSARPTDLYIHTFFQQDLLNTSNMQNNAAGAVKT